MHRYRTITQISLILSILNLVLAAPIIVQDMYEARRAERVVAEDVAAMPKTLNELEAASDRSTLSRSPPDEVASPASSQHSDGSTSSSYPIPFYSWLDMLPRLSLNPPESSPSHDSVSPYHSSQGSSGRPEMPVPEWLQEFAPAPERPPSPPLPALQSLASPLAPPHPLGSGSSEIRPSSQPTGSDWTMTQTYPPPDQFTPSHHPLPYSDESMPTPYLSASDGSPSSLYFLASDGLVPSYHSTPEGLVPSPHSMPEGLAPSHLLISDGSPPSASLPPTETLPDNAKAFNKVVMKKIGIAAAVLIVASTITAGILGSKIEHHQHRDYEDS